MSSVPSHDIEPLLTAREVSELCHCSIDFVYKAARCGWLRHIRIRSMLRFRKSDVDALTKKGLPQQDLTAATTTSQTQNIRLIVDNSNEQ